MTKTEHLIGLACGHFWPGTGATDDEAMTFLDMLIATGDSTFCTRCRAQQPICGPVARVLSRADESRESEGPSNDGVGPVQ